MDSTSSSSGSSASGLGPRAESKPRALGLDVGTRRIGVAVTDALGVMAQPVLTVHRTTLRGDLKSVARLARKHEVAAIVVGHPVRMDGDASAQTTRVEEFAAALQAHLPQVPVVFVDERLTTQEAHRLLDQSGGKRHTAADRRERAEVVDQVAAVLILEAWLTGGRPVLLPDDGGGQQG